MYIDLYISYEVVPSSKAKLFDFSIQTEQIGWS